MSGQAVRPLEERLREYASVSRTLVGTVQQEILPRMHYGPERSELAGAMEILEKVCGDVESLLRGEELEVQIAEVEL